MGFKQLKLIGPLTNQLSSSGYDHPTPIQHQAIPHLLNGKDLLGIAQTGTGKTAAFVLPLLQNLHKNHKVPEKNTPRALILAPTRELAAQVGKSVGTYGRGLKLKYTVIFGGVGQSKQVSSLDRGVDILIATPGRLMDLMNQKHIDLSELEYFILDEADRMLDMGFMPDIKRIVQKIPEKRQTVFFSATMSPKVEKFANTLLTNPVKIEVTPQATPVERIEQKVLFVDRNKKDALLLELIRSKRLTRVLVFTKMKYRANKVAQFLTKKGIKAGAIHGDKSQSARVNALKNFKAGKLAVLVATDIAARGLDIRKISHVINYDMPMEAENYVHRIGRTARAGEEGASYSFCSEHEKGTLIEIEKLTKMKIPVMKHEYHSASAESARGSSSGPRKKSKRPPKKKKTRPISKRTKHSRRRRR
jgi:ATP-dependent RNA helicase RhlE